MALNINKMDPLVVMAGSGAAKLPPVDVPRALGDIWEQLSDGLDVRFAFLQNLETGLGKF